MSNPAPYSFWVERTPVGSSASLHMASAPKPAPAADTSRDTAVTDAPPPDAPKVAKEGVLETLMEFSHFARILRVLGATIMIAAMYAFLMQGWNGGNDTTRFYMLLSQSLLLVGGGLGFSYVLKENKSARVFFWLSLLSITTSLVTLGALIFSIVHWGSALGQYPSFASWKATNMGGLLLAMAAGVVALAPTAILGFLILARRSAWPLSRVFLFTNLLLLVPVRESWMLGVVAMLAVLVPTWRVSSQMKVDATLNTREGYCAIANLFAPAIVIVIRSLFFYQVDTLLEMMLAVTGFFMARMVQSASGSDSRLLGTFSFLTAAGIAHALVRLVDMPQETAIAFLGVIIAAFGVDITLRSRNFRPLFATVTGQLLAGCEIVSFALSPTALTACFLASGGIAVLMIGKAFEQRALLLAGAAMLVIGTADELLRVIAWVDFSNWLVLAALGTTVITGASIIERHGAVIKLKCRHWLATAPGAAPQ